VAVVVKFEDTTPPLAAFLAGLHPNLVAFCDTLGWAEGTTTSLLSAHDGYDVVVTGIDAAGHPVPEVFTDFSTHPFCTIPPRAPKLVNQHGLKSDAAGKFQLMARYYAPYKVQLQLPDFGPVSQIRIAVQQIKECHALDDILTGHFTVAVAKCVSRWASLPGAGYGQHEQALTALEDVFEGAGGKFA
jgi:muramidase (phage lysozyme)